MGIIKTMINNQYDHDKKLILILIEMNKYMKTLTNRIEKLEKDNAK